MNLNCVLCDMILGEIDCLTLRKSKRSKKGEYAFPRKLLESHHEAVADEILLSSELIFLLFKINSSKHLGIDAAVQVKSHRWFLGYLY